MIGTIEDTTALSATGEREARMDPKLDTPKAGGHDEWIYSFFENPPAERPEEEAAAQAQDGREERDTPPAGHREQVYRGGQERQTCSR